MKLQHIIQTKSVIQRLCPLLGTVKISLFFDHFILPALGRVLWQYEAVPVDRYASSNLVFVSTFQNDHITFKESC